MADDTDKTVKVGLSPEERLLKHIVEYEDAPSWGGPTRYPSPPSVNDLKALLSAVQKTFPIPMILYCPRCHTQHIDEPTETWPNPPHRSHLCEACGCIWRPADVPTTGVAGIKTTGKADNWRNHASPESRGVEATTDLIDNVIDAVSGCCDTANLDRQKARRDLEKLIGWQPIETAP